ncbi:cytochrome bd-type quinol oxidase subunit 1 [Psychromicrobium silvestre]|uniref:Cytochrome bd-type quinol oxidase subunit 1 n=1 Tax=Psychromicrobium silvestre TaxID=1645614 RepID=A0A7Y9LST2_9MICC|nr:PLDc N-terminal domain-containing protein [Psychromicrobium silvestre]NYE94947.1 cytochrome bd-type quinol oxidase subunit 1 [Psychromicrobium silvestre]
MEEANPIVPGFFDLGLVVLGILFLALVIWALVSIFRSTESSAGKLLWALVVLALPLLGSAAWLIGRYLQRRQATVDG